MKRLFLLGTILCTLSFSKVSGASQDVVPEALPAPELLPVREAPLRPSNPGFIYHKMGGSAYPALLPEVGLGFRSRFRRDLGLDIGVTLHSLLVAHHVSLRTAMLAFIGGTYVGVGPGYDVGVLGPLSPEVISRSASVNSVLGHEYGPVGLRRFWQVEGTYFVTGTLHNVPALSFTWGQQF